MRSSLANWYHYPLFLSKTGMEKDGNGGKFISFNLVSLCYNLKNSRCANLLVKRQPHLGQSIQEWTKWNFLNTVFHKFHLVHSWTLYLFIVYFKSIASGYVNVRQHIWNVNTERIEKKTCEANRYFIIYF